MKSRLDARKRASSASPASRRCLARGPRRARTCSWGMAPRWKVAARRPTCDHTAGFEATAGHPARTAGRRTRGLSAPSEQSLLERASPSQPLRVVRRRPSSLSRLHAQPGLNPPGAYASARDALVGTPLSPRAPHRGRSASTGLQPVGDESPIAGRYDPIGQHTLAAQRSDMAEDQAGRSGGGPGGVCEARFGRPPAPRSPARRQDGRRDRRAGDGRVDGAAVPARRCVLGRAVVR